MIDNIGQAQASESLSEFYLALVINKMQLSLPDLSIVKSKSETLLRKIGENVLVVNNDLLLLLAKQVISM